MLTSDLPASAWPPLAADLGNVTISPTMQRGNSKRTWLCMDLVLELYSQYNMRARGVPVEVFDCGLTLQLS